MNLPTHMDAVVIREAGGPDVLKVEKVPVPQPAAGHVLIKVKAFGLNRSELFTRQGHSPNVKFPRVLGIEATGIVAAAPDGKFEVGTPVATAMGGMGRQYDGSYAEYVQVPAGQVMPIKTELDWQTVGALPEMLQTAWGSLYHALKLEPGQSLLVRGGTTSVGLAAIAIAKKRGVTVLATTRKMDRAKLLTDVGTDHVVEETGSIAAAVKAIFPQGVDKVLELVGTTTLEDSLQCAVAGGSVCMTGMVGGSWSFKDFSPMASIPHAVNLTTYSGGPDDFMRTPLQELLEQVEKGELPVTVGKVFSLNDIVKAHACMEENRAGGKIVVLP